MNKIRGYDEDQQISNIQATTGRKDDEVEDQSCLKNIIIVPSESSAKQIWDIIITFLMYFGYLVDSYNLAFFLDAPNAKIDEMWRYELPYIIDIVLLVDIFLKFFTAYQKDTEPIKDLWLIFKNYTTKYDK